MRIEERVARVLATQFYRGAADNHGIATTMSLPEYVNASMDGWLDAARGVIHLIRMEDHDTGSTESDTPERPRDGG